MANQNSTRIERVPISLNVEKKHRLMIYIKSVKPIHTSK
jgi:hypothetical protein